MLANLLSGIAIGFAAAVTPGPLSMYLLSQAASNGWRRALPVAFAPLISDGPIAVLVLSVLSQIPPDLVLYLRILGGTFILYLAFEAWKSWRDPGLEAAAGAASGSNSLVKAVFVNWLNPNPYLGWSIILGPMILSAWRDSRINGLVLLCGFYITMILVMMGMVILFAAAGTLGPRARRSLIGLSCAALTCLGLYELWLGGSSIVSTW
jgi:threonine/homoserine/homoserine lactone efflux protein